MRLVLKAADWQISQAHWEVQEAVDPAEAQAQGGVVVTRKVKLPPGPYCKAALEKGHLELLHRVFALEPPSVRTAASREPVRSVGSHRCTLRVGCLTYASGLI